MSVLATNSNTTIDGDLTKTGMTIPLIAGDTLEFIYDGTNWQQIAGSVGMGQFVKVTRAVVVDWLGNSDTSGWFEVDMSLNSTFRKGAIAADLSVTMAITGGGLLDLSIATDGTGLGNFTALNTTTANATTGFIQVPLNEDGKFWGSYALALNVGGAILHGYYI